MYNNCDAVLDLEERVLIITQNNRSFELDLLSTKSRKIPFHHLHSMIGEPLLYDKNHCMSRIYQMRESTFPYIPRVTLTFDFLTKNIKRVLPSSYM